MTKPWHPRVIPGGRAPRRGDLPAPQNAYRPVRRRRPRVSRSGLRLALLGGLFLGLAVHQTMPIPTAPSDAPGQPAETPAADAPAAWAESRRSRALLEVQEGRPTPIALRPGDSRSSADPAVRRAAGARVIDGDTFDVGGMRVRIADIDTPERDGRCASERALAARATARLDALLDAGPFELHPAAAGRDEDRFGRKLRIVSRGGENLGAVLIEEGLARAWEGRRRSWCG